MPAIATTFDPSSRAVRHLETERTQTDESAGPEPTVSRPSSSFPLLLALDDDLVARAAVRVTAAAAHACGAAPTVLRVFELSMYCTPEALPALTSAEELILAAGRNHEYRDELLSRVAALAGSPVEWRAELDVGSDVQCIISHARVLNAQLIVMGLEHHGALRRAMVGDTVRQVMSSGIAPVLAVTRSLEALPRHVVVGMDFTPSSIRAAQWARRLIDRDGSLDLVYVEPGAGSLDAHVDEQFATLIRELDVEPTMRITAVRLKGRPADRLCGYAHDVGADLIALGSHRCTLLERIRLGSVSAAVVHDARCSVLVAPPELM